MNSLILMMLLGATWTVNPGQSIQTAINNAAAGDTVFVNGGDYSGGITVNKAITVQGATDAQNQPLAKLNATTAGSGTGITIASDNCTVIGFYVNSFNLGIGVAGAGGSGGFKNNVTIRYCKTYLSQYAYWIGGTNWLIEFNDFERGKWWQAGGDCDYGRMFGSGHRFRYNYLHGTNLSNNDMQNPAGGGDFAHHDGMQYYGNNGEVLKNCVIEYNFFTDFMQGLFLSDEKLGSFDSVVIQNNVFWGKTFTNPPASNNYQGMPSWGVAIGKDVGATNITFVNNLIHVTANAMAIRAATTGVWKNNIIVYNGTIYSPPASTKASSVTIGNWLFGNNYTGDRTGYIGADTEGIDPKLRDRANPLGADGKPMTFDDGWLPTLAAAATFGPQLAGTPPPVNTAPSVTINGPQSPIQLSSGQSSTTFTLTAVGTDAEGPVTYRWNTGITSSTLNVTQTPGTGTYTCTVTDSGGLTTSATYQVVVNAYVQAPPDTVDSRLTALEAAVKALDARLKKLENVVIINPDGTISIGTINMNRYVKDFPNVVTVKTASGNKQVPTK